MKIFKYNSKRIYNFPKKAFYLGQKGRASRDNENFITSKGNIPDLIYYKQMKEFIKESQGVPPQCQKWTQLRNKHYKIMQEKSKDTSDKFKQVIDTQYLRFYVLIIPEQSNCYELVSILNYYNIRYKALEDSPISKSIMKQMLGVFNARDYKKFNFPFMMFESSEEPTRNFEGFDTILQFLIENNFIHDYRSHTAYEKDGIKFVENFETCFNNLMKNFGNLFSFYFKSTNFKEARYWYHPHKDNYVYRNRIISRLFRLLTCSIKDYKYYIQRNNKKKLFIAENEKKLQELVSTWLGRLNNKPFHGGDIPDAADFKLYSMIRKFSNCRKINFKLKKLSEENIEFMKFEDWSSKMFILCSRDNYYNIKDVGYNYNRFLDEEIISNEKINKPFTEAQQSEDDSEFKNSSSKSNVINSNKTPIMGIFGNRIKRKKINF